MSALGGLTIIWLLMFCLAVAVGLACGVLAYCAAAVCHHLADLLRRRQHARATARVVPRSRRHARSTR